MLRGLSLQDLLLLVPVLILCLTIHEISHGYVAYLLGDKTAKHMGRLSFNPIRHIDWLGLIVFITAGFGWAKPVPVNMNNFKNPKRGMAITALAGPVSNLILAFISAIILALLTNRFINNTNQYVESFLTLMILYNASLALFNLLPISPLDGSKILFSVLPNKQYYKLMQYEKYGMIILLLLVFTNIINISGAVDFLFDSIINIVSLLPI